jgi:hypothetical protein
MSSVADAVKWAGGCVAMNPSVIGVAASGSPNFSRRLSIF